MIEFMSGYPDNVLAVSATGRISADDYRKTLVPEAQRRILREGSLRLIYHLGQRFEGMTPGAMWADATLGLRHWGDFGRIAVVTDAAWITNAVRLFAPLFHHPVRVFTEAEFEDARRWILQANPEPAVT